MSQAKFMRIVTVGQGGRITLPRELRAELDLKPGDQIEFAVDGNSALLRKAQKESPFSKWQGFLREMAGQDPDAVVNEMRGREPLTD